MSGLETRIEMGMGWDDVFELMVKVAELGGAVDYESSGSVQVGTVSAGDEDEEGDRRWAASFVCAGKGGKGWVG